MHVGKQLAVNPGRQSRSAGVAPEVNLGECISQTPLPIVKATHSDFETQRKLDQKSKTGVSVAP